MTKIIRFLMKHNKLALSFFLLVAAFFSLFAWQMAEDHYKARNQTKFENTAHESVKKIESHLLRCGDILTTGVSHINASNNVTRENWHTFTQGLNIETNYPGMQGFGFSIMLKPEEVASIEHKMHSEGDETFALKPQGIREKYSTILYLEPINKRNLNAIGYDMYSNPIRKMAMDLARDTGKPALSGKVTLVQEIDTNKQAGVLLYTPVYKKGIDKNSLQERQQGLIGFVYSPFRMDDLMNSTGARSDEIDFKIYDGSDISDESLMFDSSKNSSYVSKYTLKKSLTLYNRTWTILLSSSPKFDASNNTKDALLVTAGILVAYFILLVIIFSLVKSRFLLQQQKQQLQTLQAEIMERSYVLEESETKYRSLIENIPGIAYRCKFDKDWTMLFMSKAVDTITGYSSDEFIVNKVTSYGALILPEDSGYVEESVAKAIEKNEVWEIEYKIRHKDGSIRNVYEKGKAIFDHNGNVEYLDGFLLDVTQQKLMADALWESNERFQILFDASPDPTWIIDDHVFVECNQAAIDILGYPNKDSLMNAHPSDLSPELQPDGEYSYNKAEKMMLATRGKGVHRFEWTHRRWDKSDFFAEVTLSAITLQGKEVLACTWRDISERKKAEAALYSALSIQKAIFENAGSAIITTDIEGLITSYNKAAEVMLGYSSEEMVDKQSPAILFKLDEIIQRAQELSQELGEVVEPGFKVFAIKADYNLKNIHEWTYVLKDGSEIPAVLNVTAMRNINGDTFGYLGISTDMTLFKEAETKIIQAKEAAEASARAKSEFLAAMSHEIRTPMNGVLGMLGLLEKSKLEDTQRHHVQVATSSATSLLGLINDILDFSKIEAGKMDLEMLEFDLKHELKNFKELIEFKTEEKGIDLDLIMDIAYPNIISDPSRLRQILTNLVGNAVKFTARGGIQIKAALKQMDNTRGHLHIDVIDTGIGIPKHRIDTLFEAFTQADGSTTRKYGGTGLGLSIVKKLCELMGGSISATSTPGVGSTFSVDLNVGLGSDQVAAKPIKQETAEENIVWPSNTRILLVEDNPTNQLVAQGMLDSLGLYADIAANGLEALEAIRISNDTQAYTLVLMDCQMPEMDGYDATRAVREGKVGEENKQLPIIAMTANAMQGDRMKCTLAGMDDYIAKPVNLSVLKSALIKWILKDKAYEPSNNERSVAQQTTPADLPLWDEADALHRLGGNSALLNKIVQSFMNDGPKSLSALRTALDENKSEDAQLHAHSLKGSAGNVGAIKLQEISKHLEEAAKNKNLTEIRAGFEECENTLNETLKVFETHLAKEVKPTVRKKRLDPLQMAIKLQALKKELENGIVINTEASGIFVEYTDEAFSEKMAKLKEHIDAFKSAEALMLLETIMAGLE